jgi:hypothetical protein
MIPDPVRSGLADVELWIILGYVAAVLIGARIVEALARLHFARAQRHSEQGFEYIEAQDLYRCPQGEQLFLHRVEHENRVAVYRARSSSCRRCPLKAACTPFDEGRVVMRSMAAWAETDVGVFHRRVSILMVTAAVVVCAAGLRRWTGQPGSSWLTIALFASLAILIQDLHMIWLSRRRGSQHEAQRHELRR